MDEHRRFLEAQVKTSEDGVEQALQTIKTALGAFDSSFDDMLTWRKALEKYTRASEEPFTAPPQSNPLDALLAGRVVQEVRPDVKPEAKRERPVREERPPMPPKFSKRGAVRDFLQSQERGLDVSEVFRSLPHSDYPESITKADLYRILPGLYARGEATRDARGKYSAVRPKGSEDNGHLHFAEGMNEPVLLRD